MSTVNDVMKAMEQIAPVSLKEDFDNVGLMVGDRNSEVKKVLFALDCTLAVIEEAKKEQADMIITHHPLIFRKPSSITTDTLQGKKILELIQNHISLYSSHTNLDSVAGGINERIGQMLGFDHSEILDRNHIDASAGIGRIMTPKKPIPVTDFIQKVKEVLDLTHMRAVIAGEEIHKLAIINGSGQDYIAKAVALGADCILTGDTTYHFASDYKEMGITILDAGHFSTEHLVFFDVMKKLEKQFSDVTFVFSSVEEDPYMFV